MDGSFDPYNHDNVKNLMNLDGNSNYGYSECAAYGVFKEYIWIVYINKITKKLGTYPFICSFTLQMNILHVATQIKTHSC